MSKTSNSLTVEDAKDLVTWKEKEIQLLKNTIAKGLTDQEFLFFGSICKAKDLNPLLGEIYVQVYKDAYGNRNLVFVTGIDGFRKAAHRTGVYAGRDKAIVIPSENQNYPDEIEVTVHKIVQGIKCSFTATAKWKEYLPQNPKKRHLWNKMPFWMLEKCAEAKALRMGFPQELGGLYEEAEAHQIGDKESVKDGEGKNMNDIVNIKGLPEAKEEDVPHLETIDQEQAAEENNDDEKPEPEVDELPITAKQRQRLFAISRSKKWKDAQVKEAMLQLTGIDSSTKLTKEPYDFLVKFIKENPPEALNAE